MQDHENTDPIAPKREIGAPKALIANAVCKSVVVSGFLLCATSAESASLPSRYERRYDAAHLATLITRKSYNAVLPRTDGNRK
jgi:hypothetical protein